MSQGEGFPADRWLIQDAKLCFKRLKCLSVALETFMGFMVQQRMLKSPVPVEKLFVDVGA